MIEPNGEYLSQTDEDIFQVVRGGLQLAEQILLMAKGKSTKSTRIALNYIGKYGDWTPLLLHPWYRRYLMLRNYGADEVEAMNQEQYPHAKFYPGETILYHRTLVVTIDEPLPPPSVTGTHWQYYSVFGDRGERVEVPEDALTRLHSGILTHAGAIRIGRPEHGGAVIEYVEDVGEALFVYKDNEKLGEHVPFGAEGVLQDASTDA